MIRVVKAAVVAVALLFVAMPVRAVDLDAFVRTDAFHQIMISPTGEYLAATVPRSSSTRCWTIPGKC